MAQVDIPLFYDTDRRVFTTGAGDVATVTKIQLGQLNTVDVILAIVKDDVAIELTSPSWVLGIKQINDQSGDYLIQSTTATKTGTGTSTRYTFTFDFDSTELRAFFDTYDPTEDYLALEIRDTVNGIVTLPALIIDPLPAYTVEGTTPTDAGGTLIVASGKTATIANTITLTGTDGETYDLDEFGDIPAVRYTNNQGLNSTQKGHARENIDVPSTTDLTDTLTAAKAYFVTPYKICVRDHFVGAGASGGIYGELGWQIGGGASYSFRGWEENHPGILRMTRSATGTGYLYLSWLTGQGMGGFTGLKLTAFVRLTAITNVVANFGLAGIGALTTAGRKGWIFDPAVSANWQLAHGTSAGVMTYTDSGIAATTGWAILTIRFDGATSYGTVKTLGGTSAEISNSGAATAASADHSVNFSITVSSGTQSMDVDFFQLESVGEVTGL